MDFSYAHLQAMLAQGWQTKQSVYLRPRWCSCTRLGREDVYHFVLWYGDKVTLVGVLDCPEVQRFLADNELAVERL